MRAEILESAGEGGGGKGRREEETAVEGGMEEGGEGGGAVYKEDPTFSEPLPHALTSLTPLAVLPLLTPPRSPPHTHLRQLAVAHRLRT